MSTNPNEGAIRVLERHLCDALGPVDFDIRVLCEAVLRDIDIDSINRAAARDAAFVDVMNNLNALHGETMDAYRVEIAHLRGRVEELTLALARRGGDRSN